MAPVPLAPSFTSESGDKILSKKPNDSGVNGNGVTYDDKGLEDYMGNYRFAPIEEADVSRAMIKRSVDPKIMNKIISVLTLDID